MRRRKYGIAALSFAGLLLLTACGPSEDIQQDADSETENAVLDSAGTVQSVPGTDSPAETDASQEMERGQMEDIWSGDYVADEEKVTLSALDESMLSFSFAQAGISGMALAKGSQAVYQGDDNYVVTFQVSGTVLEVSVSSAEGDDASGSPLNGTYIKEMS